MSSSSSMKPATRNALVGGAIVLVLLLIVAIALAVQSSRDTAGDKGRVPGESSSSGATGTGSSDQSGQPTKGAPGLVDTYGLGIGDPKAPVKVEIFEDFQCPFCKMFEATAREDLMQAAADGDAYVVYRPMAFLNDYSGRAMNAFGVVLDASEGEVAQRFHDLLFENQPSESGPFPSDEELVDLAVEAGADVDDVQRGIEKLEFGQWVVNATDAASKRKVTGNSIGELLDGVLAEIEAG